MLTNKVLYSVVLRIVMTFQRFAVLEQKHSLKNCYLAV